MDYENRAIACWDARYTKEENMILGNRHDGVVIGRGDLCSSLVFPGDGTWLRGFQRLHVQ